MGFEITTTITCDHCGAEIVGHGFVPNEANVSRYMSDKGWMSCGESGLLSKRWLGRDSRTLCSDCVKTYKAMKDALETGFFGGAE